VKQKTATVENGTVKVNERILMIAWTIIMKMREW
jgi:hypothetical protein